MPTRTSDVANARSVKQAKDLLADELDVAIAMLSEAVATAAETAKANETEDESIDSFFALKGPLGTLRANSPLLEGTVWSRQPDKAVDYNYTLLHTDYPFVIIVFQQVNDEQDSMNFGTALLNWEYDSFVEASAEQLMDWLVPDDMPYAEQLIMLAKAREAIDRAISLTKVAFMNA